MLTILAKVLQVTSEQKRRILGVEAKDLSHMNSKILGMMSGAPAKMPFLYNDFVNTKKRK